MIDRRAFIVSTGAAAVGAAASAARREDASEAPHAFRSPSGQVVPYRPDEIHAVGPQRSFTREALSEIAFPLGGIGTGTISLG